MLPIVQLETLFTSAWYVYEVPTLYGRMVHKTYNRTLHENKEIVVEVYNRVRHFFLKNLIRRAFYSPRPGDFKTVFIFFLRLIFLE